MLVHKTSLNKYNKIKIAPSIFSDYNAFKLEMNCKEEIKKPKYVETKQHTTKKLLGQRRNNR